MNLLETRSLSVTFGGLRANADIDIDVGAGRLVGLIGPNGAGKTTFIDGLTGFVPTTGRIRFDGREISELAPHARARLGLARTWQSLELFDDLTVRENLQVAADRPTIRGFLADLVRPTRPQHHDSVDFALEVLELGHLAARMPPELSQGQSKLVSVARAIASRPRLLCMDEPAAGLDSSESAELGRVLRRIVEVGITILLIDHDMGLVMNVCDDIYVIEFGRLIAHGPPSEVLRDPAVIAAYLGDEAAGTRRGAQR